MIKEFIWIGAPGYTPDLGSVAEGQVVTITNDKIAKRLLEQKLITAKEEPKTNKVISKKNKE